MKVISRNKLALIWFTTLLCIPVWGWTAQQRYALVIGNAAYKNETPLTNTLNDARDVAAKLKGLGFEVTKVENAGRRKLSRSVNQFLRQVQGSDAVALVYYSGHGLQVNGRNYLIPVDAQVSDELDVPSEGLSVNRILGGLGDRGDNAVNLVILDACRNNPFKKEDSKAFGDKGLARVIAPGGTLILYATKPGETASDNSRGENGLFTKHLLQAMDQQGKEVEDAFKEAAQKVYLASGRRQDPWMEGRIRGRFYFIPPPPPGMMPPPVPGPRPVAPVVHMELEVWKAANQCGTTACFQAYLDQFPRGRFAAIARARIVRTQPKTPELIPFTVKTTPEGARVRILNIGPKYQDGIELKPGRYRIEATQPGYRKHLGWHVLSETNPVYVAELEELPPDALHPVFSSPPASRPQSTQSRLRPSSGGRVGQPWRDPSTGMEFVWVPSGCYQMGSNSGVSDEKPVHEVCVDGYWLGKYEVTQGQWKRVMGGNPSKFKKGDSHPVEQVSWNDVQDYVRKLNGKGGAKFRLPTEAEWEYACRSGGKDEKYSGSNSVDRVAWYLLSNSGGTTHRVGTKSANGLGLHDMSGNVWEWVQDIYGNNAYSSHSRNNPVNTGGGSYRVFRGGGWASYDDGPRCANRLDNDPGFRGDYMGFRLLRK